MTNNEQHVTRIAKRTRDGYRGLVTVYEGDKVQTTRCTKVTRQTPVEALHDAEMLRRDIIENERIAQVK